MTRSVRTRSTSPYLNDITRLSTNSTPASSPDAFSEIIELFRAYPPLPAGGGRGLQYLYLALSFSPDGGKHDGVLFLLQRRLPFHLPFASVDPDHRMNDPSCGTAYASAQIQRKDVLKAHVITNVQKYIGSHVMTPLINGVTGVSVSAPTIDILF